VEVPETTWKASRFDTTVRVQVNSRRIVPILNRYDSLSRRCMSIVKSYEEIV
jgi:hypothetical protein